MSRIDLVAWQIKMNTSSHVSLNLNATIGNIQLEQWLRNLTWTPQSTDDWQEFYDRAQRIVGIYRGTQVESQVLPTLPKYEDLQIEPCYRKPIAETTDMLGSTSGSSVTVKNTLLYFLVLVLFVITKSFD